VLRTELSVYLLSGALLSGCASHRTGADDRTPAIPQFDRASLVERGTSAVVGTLVDTNSRLGLFSAQLRLISRTDSTLAYVNSDSRGGFIIGKLRPGNYSYLARAIGYHPEIGKLILRAGVVDTLNLRMSRSSHCGGTDCQ
jgi:hypothetical protein